MTGSLRALCTEFSARTKLFECPSCPKKFLKPSALKVHTYSHTGEKPHKCQDCDKHFSVLSNLRRHIKTHVKAPHRRKSAASNRCVPSLPSNSPRKLKSSKLYQDIMPENSGSFVSSFPYSSTSSSSCLSSSSSLPGLSLSMDEGSSVNISAVSTPGSSFAPAHPVHDTIHSHDYLSSSLEVDQSTRPFQISSAPIQDNQISSVFSLDCPFFTDPKSAFVSSRMFPFRLLLYPIPMSV